MANNENLSLYCKGAGLKKTLLFKVDRIQSEVLFTKSGKLCFLCFLHYLFPNSHNRSQRRYSADFVNIDKTRIFKNSSQSDTIDRYHHSKKRIKAFSRNFWQEKCDIECRAFVFVLLWGFLSFPIKNQKNVTESLERNERQYSICSNSSP